MNKITSKILQHNTSKTKGTRLSKDEVKFKIVFEVKLDNGFEIKDMKQQHTQDFHKFLSDTIYKNLTISQVETLFLRKQGDAPAVKSHNEELLHFGKSSKPFRIFGYYNSDGYFVICRIDGAHETNKV